jgi:hypothetical protein
MERALGALDRDGASRHFRPDEFICSLYRCFSRESVTGEDAINGMATWTAQVSERSWIATLGLSRGFISLIFMTYAASLPVLAREWSMNRYAGRSRTDLFFSRFCDLLVYHLVAFRSHRRQADISLVLLARGRGCARFCGLCPVFRTSAVALCLGRLHTRRLIHACDHTGGATAAAGAAPLFGMGR